MKLAKPLILMIIAAILLAACAPGQTQSPDGAVAQPTPAGETQIPAAETAAQWLADQLGIDPGELTLRSVEDAQWMNACLELPEMDEACAEVVVAGYKIVFEANGVTYEVRTDLEGKQIRAEGLDLPKGGPVVVPDPASEAAQQAAVQALADKLGLEANAITVTSVEAVDWPDSCLGVANPAESCLAVITPGYRILLEAEGAAYQVNTNLDGSAFRVLEQPAGGSGSGAADPQAAEQAARAYLAQQLGVAEDAITLVTLEAVDWPDSCLGVSMPDRMCAQVITPGFRILLEAEGRNYEFHTDQAGGQVAAALAPLPEGMEDVIVWEDTEGDPCRQAVIGAASVQYGACGADLESADLPEERLSELAYFFGNYAAFEGETGAGKVTFKGEGQREPTEAEMRSVAEWAALVVDQAMSSRGESGQGVVITYHREGGFAGFCSDATIDRSGWVFTSSCKGGQERSYEPYLLSGEELERLYEWIDTLEGFELEQKDAAVADAMITRVIFEGQGTQEASSAQQDEIMQFADRALSSGETR